jgi:hypothetical protein
MGDFAGVFIDTGAPIDMPGTPLAYGAPFHAWLVAVH